MPRNNIFLEDQLHRIGEILHKASCPESEYIAAVWACSILEKGGAAPLHPYQHRDKTEWYKGPEGNPQDDQEDIKL
jgi:hypothetical protein